MIDAKNFPGRGQVAILRTTPATVLDDYARLMRLLPDNGSHDHTFLVTEERVVRNDGTIVFGGRLFETDFELRACTVEVRRRLSQPERLHVYHGGEHIGVARPLNRTLNAKLPRRKTTTPQQGDHT